MNLRYDKKCGQCGEVKSTDKYHRRKDTIDGFQYHCKECARRNRIARARRKGATPMPDGPLEQLYTRVPPGLKLKIADLAEHRGTSMNRTVYDLLRIGVAMAERNRHA